MQPTLASATLSVAYSARRGFTSSTSSSSAPTRSSSFSSAAVSVVSAVSLLSLLLFIFCGFRLPRGSLLFSTTCVAYCARKGFHLWTCVGWLLTTHVVFSIASVSQTSRHLPLFVSIFSHLISVFCCTVSVSAPSASAAAASEAACVKAFAAGAKRFDVAVESFAVGTRDFRCCSQLRTYKRNSGRPGLP